MQYPMWEKGNLTEEKFYPFCTSDTYFIAPFTLCLWNFGGTGALARYPFPYGFLCIVRAEGFKAAAAAGYSSRRAARGYIHFVAYLFPALFAPFPIPFDFSSKFHFLYEIFKNILYAIDRIK